MAKAITIRNLAEGDARQFDLILNAYNYSPAIVKDRLYIETMNMLFKGKNITLVDPNIRGVMPIFPMNSFLNVNLNNSPLSNAMSKSALMNKGVESAKVANNNNNLSNLSPP